jgi:Tol biopolymer transport system component
MKHVSGAKLRSAKKALVGVSLLVAVSGCDQVGETAGDTLTGPAFAAHKAMGPEIFAPGVISDNREQWRITFTPDGKTAYFATSSQFFPFTRRATIYVSHYSRGEWSTPEVTPFSGTHSDIDPFLSPNGQRLYFSSIRPLDGSNIPVNPWTQDIDLWMVERTPHGWSEPIHLGREVNRPGTDEIYPSVSADGTLYFASGPLFPQAGRHFDIYRAERSGDGFASREALSSAVNTSPVAGGGRQDAWEFNPEISVDGKTLVFTSLRPGGYGLGDLYVSHFRQGEWTPAQNLGPVVNTAADEYHPTLSRDRRHLYFVRRLGQGDFFRVETRLLNGF